MLRTAFNYLNSLSKPAVIERLIDWADETLTKSLYDNESAFNRYIDRA
jgi:hypothetical protein